MGESIIPTSVRDKCNAYGLNMARRVLAADPRLGDVYELYYAGNSSGPVMPTGLPVLVSFKDGIAHDIPADKALDIVCSFPE